MAVPALTEDLTQQTAGAVTAAIPTSQTMFSAMNIYIVVGLLIIVPLLNVAMFPSKDEVVEVDLSQIDMAPLRPPLLLLLEFFD